CRRDTLTKIVELLLRKRDAKWANGISGRRSRKIGGKQIAGAGRCNGDGGCAQNTAAILIDIFGGFGIWHRRYSLNSLRAQRSAVPPSIIGVDASDRVPAGTTRAEPRLFPVGLVSGHAIDVDQPGFSVACP